MYSIDIFLGWKKSLYLQMCMLNGFEMLWLEAFKS